MNKIFELIGVDRPDREYEGENALCCSGPIICTDKELAVEIQKDNMEGVIGSGTEALVTICPVCDAVLRRPTTQFGMNKIFITDLVRMALGEVPWPDS